MEINALSIKQLCDIADVTSRTVTYYIQLGILPHAGTSGRGARYERRHLIRLQLIKLLQREHQPLAEIRERLKGLSDDQVEMAVADASRLPPDLTASLQSATGSVTPPVGPDRSQWDRIELTRDVELHIRRPLTRERNRRVERLLEEARRIMKDGGR